jgi:hypothetical protein
MVMMRSPACTKVPSGSATLYGKNEGFLSQNGWGQTKQHYHKQKDAPELMGCGWKPPQSKIFHAKPVLRWLKEESVVSHSTDRGITCVQEIVSGFAHSMQDIHLS